MKASLNMSNEQEIHVHSWWAKKPEFFINALKSQLETAVAIWPELKDYAIAKRRIRRRVQKREERPDSCALDGL